MRNMPATGECRSPHISGLKIRKLFGYCNYNIEPKEGAENAFRRLVILYGLNGTGKTTILRLLYHLLSPRERSGHKTFVARTRFQLFQIDLSDGTSVSASRPKALDGTFTLTVAPPGRKPVSHEFLAVGKRPTIPAGREEGQSYRELMKALEALGYTFNYLADDRTVSVEPLLSQSGGDTYEVIAESIRFVTHSPEEEERESIVTALEQALSRFNMFVSRQASSLSKTGAAFTHSVYADVITQIVTKSPKGGRPTADSVEDQLAQLRHIAAESVTLEIYGLSTRVDVEPLIKTIQNAPSSRRRLVRQLLPPYVAALQGRLRELRDLHTLIDAFVGHLSKYLAPKNVSFSVQDGLVLLSPTGDRLSPGMLSSGERHLLLIMCTACVATTSHTLCIIDEPEISLNIMWQRTLLRTLLDIAAESNLQFIVASHSIPLITQHREHVVELLQMGERTHE